MQYVEIVLGGERFVARLLDDRAPATCRALWESLPLAGRAVHTTISGELFELLEPSPLAVAETEAPVGYQYPGLVVYDPARPGLAVCYGKARYRGTAGPRYVTPLAEIVGDLTALRARAARLQWDGATPIELRRCETPPAVEPPAGTRLELELDGAVATALLLEQQAPKTCAAIVALLPLDGPATNTAWSGGITRFWGPIGKEGTLGLKFDPPEAPTPFHWTGYLYYHIAWDGIRICFGDGQQSGAFSVSNMTPFARLEGDWSAFRERASRLHITGAKPMQIRLKT